MIEIIKTCHGEPDEYEIEIIQRWEQDLYDQASRLSGNDSQVEISTRALFDWNGLVVYHHLTISGKHEYRQTFCPGGDIRYDYMQFLMRENYPKD